MKELLIESLKVAIPLALAALAYYAAMAWKRFRAQKGASDAERAAIEAACVIAKKLLDQMLFGALTAAERDWGGGTGAAKLDSVREKVLSLLPENVRGLIPADWLQCAVESGLAAAKKKWEINPALISNGNE